LFVDEFNVSSILFAGVPSSLIQCIAFIVSISCPLYIAPTIDGLTVVTVVSEPSKPFL
jgi:hypothetical protein